jgi:hypothetical protein
MLEYTPGDKNGTKFFPFIFHPVWLPTGPAHGFTIGIAGVLPSFLKCRFPFITDENLYHLPQ